MSYLVCVECRGLFLSISGKSTVCPACRLPGGVVHAAETRSRRRGRGRLSLGKGGTPSTTGKENVELRELGSQCGSKETGQSTAGHRCSAHCTRHGPAQYSVDHGGPKHRPSRPPSPERGALSTLDSSRGGTAGREEGEEGGVQQKGQEQRQNEKEDGESLGSIPPPVGSPILGCKQPPRRASPQGLHPPAADAVSQVDDRCCICRGPLGHLPYLERQLHMNACIDARENPEPAGCTVCGMDLGFMPRRDREVHVNECLDGSIQAAAAAAAAAAPGPVPALELRHGGASGALPGAWNEEADSSSQRGGRGRKRGRSPILPQGGDDPPPVLAAADEQATLPPPAAAAAAAAAASTASKAPEAVRPPPPPSPQRGAPADIRNEQYRCRFCGADLSASVLGARLRHIKKCGQRYGARVSDMVREREEEEEEAVPDVSETSDTAEAFGESGQGGPLRQTTMASFFQSPQRSASDVLMQGARRLARAGGGRGATQAAAGRGSEQGRGRGRGVGGGATRGWGQARGRGAGPAGGRGRWARGGGRNGPGRQVVGGRRRLPGYKRVPGTKAAMVVDGFQYATSAAAEGELQGAVYFLTHFHADHYGGLTSRFDLGPIYLSEVTARLVAARMQVPRGLLRPLPLGRITLIKVGGEKVAVTLLDANHCPGAVMFLFQVPGGKTYLHVGDFRWSRTQMLAPQSPLAPFATPDSGLTCPAWAHPEAAVAPVLAPEVPAPAGGQGAGGQRRRLAGIFLDTTYLHPKHVFPAQADAIDATLQVVSKALAGPHGRDTLVLFGAYSIGKERLYMEVAERLGLHIHVDRKRRDTLSLLGWTLSTMARLTTDEGSTPLRVVPISHINFERMRQYSKRKALQADYHHIVGIQPTGWSFNPKRKGWLSCRTSQGMSIYGVPYSEHSSFPELVECIKCLGPERIIPTVNCGTAERVKEQLEILAAAGAPVT